MISGITAKRVNNPTKTKEAQRISAKTVKPKDTSGPSPIGSPNSKLPLTNFCNFPNPCVNINPPAAKRTNNNDKSINAG